MVRHIRDPVTGRCVVCDQQHGPNTVVNVDRGPSSWDNVKKKVIYMNAFNPQRSPSPKRSRDPSPERVYVGHPPVQHGYQQPRTPRTPRDYDDDSRSGASSVRSQSRVHLIPAGGGYGGGYGQRDPYDDDRDRRGRSPERNPKQPPPARERTPSPSGAGCCGKSARRTGDRNYGAYRDGKAHGYPGRNRGVGASAQRSSVYNGQASNWGKRRCCALLVGFLVAALVIGLAVGLFYGITAAETAAEENAPENKYPGGYYVDGVYVIPVTESVPKTYLVFGLDTPCNAFNNNTDGEDNELPNCADVTTRLVESNVTVPTQAAVAVTGADGADGSGADGSSGAPQGVGSSAGLLMALICVNFVRRALDHM